VLAHQAGAWASAALPLEQKGVETTECGTSSTLWAPVPVRATVSQKC
jgi:hypothetical protein